VENTLFGTSVTTAGLLPGGAIRACLERRGDLDLALIPGEAVNDNGLFIDSVPVRDLAASVAVPIRTSYDFADAVGPLELAVQGSGSFVPPASYAPHQAPRL
jgi:L-ascorbate metabolism protein UlaG (beta-lactamase superfamily)